MRPGQLSRKYHLIALSRFAIVGLKSSASRYFVCSIMLFETAYYYYFSWGTSHIPVCLFLFPFIISWPLFWNDIYCLSSVMVHPSSHKTPNNISGAVFVFGTI